ncbi:hypothetical protein YC2023_022868 [Brassica napus]
MLSLDKQRPESSSSEEVQAVTPWVVSGNVDHEKVIEKFGCDRIDESLIAVAGDKNCQWKLIVYPQGNKKDNGEGFISMYVEIDSESLTSTPQCDVFAELIFFVYNKKENKYFTIQDVEVKRFNALKKIWGLQQVLPSDAFNKLENGYIFEGDQCEFGVEVIVPSPLTKWEILSFNEKLQYPKFSWTVEKFSQLKEDNYISNTFSMGAWKWVLWLYPKGESRADGKWLSLYLVLADRNTLKADEKILTQANLRVLDPLRSNHLERKLNHWHNETNSGWGWNKFLSLAELRKSYLDTEDALTVEIEFEVVACGDSHYQQLLSDSGRTMLHFRWRKVVVQSQLLVSAGKGRPMHELAELLSRPGGGLWNSARIVPSSFGSPLVDYYSKYHRTPNRKKLSKEEYEQLTQETARKAMAGLAACPGFGD